VKLAGEIWSARSLDSERVHEPGATVRVIKIDGATALVD
jgi:membrane protein implicated in regulation of membrane protease activity